MQSEAIAEIAKALSKFQGQLQPAIKDSTNPFFKVNYADLASVWEAARKPLSDNGLSIVQGIEGQLPSAIAWTLLLHTSGEWIRSEIPLLVSKPDAQGIGAALTYYRRYGMAAILGITQEDDDGNTAGKVDTKKQEAKQPAGRTVGDSKLDKAKSALTNAKDSATVDKIALKIENELGDLPIAQLDELRTLGHKRKQSFTQGA
jgi:hypothetical protein